MTLSVPNILFFSKTTEKMEMISEQMDLDGARDEEVI